MTRRVLFAVGFALALAVPAGATPVNAALGKPVTITGVVGITTCCGWPDATTYPPAALSTITDGVYLAESTEWQNGSVWWDENEAASANNVIEIDLQGLYLISSLSLQADNNDNYEINYRDRFGVWHGLGYFPGVCCFGMTTRNAGISPLEASAFQIDAFGGDLFYSVSEFQATGELVPEPASMILLGTGLLGLVARRRKIR